MTCGIDVCVGKRGPTERGQFRDLAFPTAAGYDEDVKIGRSGRARAKVHVAYRAGFAARAGWVAGNDDPFRRGSVRPVILYIYTQSRLDIDNFHPLIMQAHARRIVYAPENFARTGCRSRLTDRQRPPRTERATERPWCLCCLFRKFSPARGAGGQRAMGSIKYMYDVGGGGGLRSDGGTKSRRVLTWCGLVARIDPPAQRLVIMCNPGQGLG